MLINAHFFKFPVIVWFFRFFLFFFENDLVQYFEVLNTQQGVIEQTSTILWEEKLCFTTIVKYNSFTCTSLNMQVFKSVQYVKKLAIFTKQLKLLLFFCVTAAKFLPPVISTLSLNMFYINFYHFLLLNFFHGCLFKWRLKWASREV